MNYLFVQSSILSKIKSKLNKFGQGCNEIGSKVPLWFLGCGVMHVIVTLQQIMQNLRRLNCNIAFVFPRLLAVLIDGKQCCQNISNQAIYASTYLKYFEWAGRAAGYCVLQSFMIFLKKVRQKLDCPLFEYQNWAGFLLLWPSARGKKDNWRSFGGPRLKFTTVDSTLQFRLLHKTIYYLA